MTRVQARLGDPATLIASGALVAALLIGLLLAYDPVYGVAALFAALYVPLALINMPLAIAMWLPLLFLEGLPGGAMLPDAGAIVVVGAWLGVAVRRGSWQRLQLKRMRVQILAVVALLAWLMLSMLWARDPGRSGTLWVSWVIVAALFLVVATALSRPAHLRLVMWAFVVGAVTSITIGFGLQQVGVDAVEVEGRFQAGAGDPNYLGAQVVGAFALLFGLLGTARQPLERLALIGCLIPLTYGLVASQSRGALVAVVVLVVLAPIVFSRHRMRVLGITLVAIAALAMIVAVTPSATERIFSSDDRGSGRADLWTVGFRVIEDHSPLGVGLDNFGLYAPEYTRLPGQLQNVNQVLKGQEAHNLYLGLLAETGLPGLILFLLVVGISIGSGLRAARIFEALGKERMGILSRAATLGLIGMLSASFFLPNGTDKRLWVLLAIATAMLGVAEHLRRREPEPVTVRRAVWD